MTNTNPEPADTSAPGADDRIYMLNALWFKPDGGREKYMSYLAAAGPLVARYGGRRVGDAYVPQEAVYGELDADLVFIVEWPSREIFMSFATDPEYQEVRHLREEAITRSLLIRCQALRT